MNPNFYWNCDMQDAHASIVQDMELCDHMFVYGTLQDGFSNHSLMGKSKKIAETKTSSNFVLGDVGFPYAFPHDVVPKQYEYLLGRVEGELYSIADPDTFMTIDFLEGHPSHYTRYIVGTTQGVNAWMYHQLDWSCAKSCMAANFENGVWKW